MTTPTPRPSKGDYRIFVGAFPEDPLAAKIQALREQYDPKTAQITPPHVTIAGTYWRDGPATPENEAKIMAQLSALIPTLPALTLTFGGISDFRGRVVYLDMDLPPALAEIRQALVGLLGRDKHKGFTPHLTLAMRLSKSGSRAMLQELQHSDWHTQKYPASIAKLQLMQRGPDDPAWRTIGSWPLRP